MPIGTIIGWLIAQIFIGTLLIVSNNPKNDSKVHHLEATRIARVNARATGHFLWITGACALFGTFVELIVT